MHGDSPPEATARDRTAVALATAQQALEEIEALDCRKYALSAVKAACMRQLARCHRLAGDSATAEAALRHGMELGDACSSILLAKNLLSSGQSAEASAVLSEASSTFRESAHACREWLGAIDVAQVEVACMSHDLLVARSALEGAVATGGRAASVARALVATAVCAHACEFVKVDGLSSEVKQTLSEVRRHALQSLEGCDGADVKTVSASAAAESERLRGKPDAAGLWQAVVHYGYRDIEEGKRRKGACMHVAAEAEAGAEEESGVGGAAEGFVEAKADVAGGDVEQKAGGRVADAESARVHNIVVRLAGTAHS